jgi:hypothetical protein
VTGKVRRLLSLAFERPLISKIGEPFLNADGFGITWHTDARSDFNPFPEGTPSSDSIGGGQRSDLGTSDDVSPSADPLTDPVYKTDGPLLPFVLGPHPAIYKTTIAKP